MPGQRSRRNRSIFIGVLWTLLVCLALPSLTLAKTKNKDKKAIAGLYFLQAETDFPPGFPFTPFTALLNLAEDGSVVTDPNFAPGGTDFSTGLGVWKRIQDREVEIRFYFFVYSEDPGTALETSRVTLMAEFDTDFHEFEAPFIVEGFSPDLDPFLDEPDNPNGFVTGFLTGSPLNRDDDGDDDDED